MVIDKLCPLFKERRGKEIAEQTLLVEKPSDKAKCPLKLLAGITVGNQGSANPLTRQNSLIVFRIRT